MKVFVCPIGTFEVAPSLDLLNFIRVSECRFGLIDRTDKQFPVKGVFDPNLDSSSAFSLPMISRDNSSSSLFLAE